MAINIRTLYHSNSIVGRILRFVTSHLHYFAFVLFAFLIELSSIYLMTSHFFILNPIPFLLLLGVIILLCIAIKNTRATIIIFGIVIFIFGVLNIIFQNGYFAQGECTFSLQQMAFLGIGLEATDVSNLYFNVPFIIFIILFTLIMFGFLFYKKVGIPLEKPVFHTKLQLIQILVFILFTFLSPLMLIGSTGFNKYNYSKYKKPIVSAYYEYSVLGNFLLEFVGNSTKPYRLSKLELTDSLHLVNNKANGVSKENNLVILCVETFEYMGFIQDSIKYPNGLNGFSSESLHELFPNLYYLLEQDNNGYVSPNHYSKDKTNNTEAELILGSLPSVKNFSEILGRDYFFSLPNMLRSVDGSLKTQYFHNNPISIYDRGDYMNSFGFQEVYGKERILSEHPDEELSYMSYQAVVTEQSFLTDSSMMELMKEQMFPLDERFFTFWLTLTMHGPYNFPRDIFQDNKDKLLSKTDSHMSNEFINYVISVMDFDKALGIMFNYLKSNNLLHKTTIVIQGDHDAYMSDLSSDVKNLDNDNIEKYNLPLIIYDEKLEQESLVNSSSTFSVVPTVLELFGVPYYREMYLSDSLFVESNEYNYLRSYGYSFFGNINGLFYGSKNLGASNVTVENLNIEAVRIIDEFIKRQTIIDNYYLFHKSKSTFI